MAVLALTGCMPEPLAAYLRALGVLRLVAEQADPDARGFWKDDVFHLQTRLDDAELTEFFLDEYSPTPVVAPWNGGSGFYEGDRTDGFEAILSSAGDRFAEYRRTIAEIRSWPELPGVGKSIRALIEEVRTEARTRSGKAQADALKAVADVEARLAAAPTSSASRDPVELSVAELEELPQDPSMSALLRVAKKLRTRANKIARSAGKDELVRAARQRLGDRSVEWIDAAVVLSANGVMQFPPLLGSGGNEGRLDYTNVFARHIAALIVETADRAVSQALLRNALFSEPTNHLVTEPVGQYEPGRAGGFNQGPGIETQTAPSNPWGVVLAVEGSLVWTSGAARRHSATSISSPFTVRPRPVGFSSATQRDGGSSRAEVWAPLWSRPLSLPELRAFLGEGRAEIGRRQAVDGIQFAEAAASLGTDRGVSEFVRYGLLKRRGDSYIALPAGRVAVRARTEAELVRQLDPILSRLDAFLRRFPNQEPPAQLASARRRIDELLFEALARGGADRVKHLVAALGRMEALLAHRDPGKDPKLGQPLVGLGAEWITGADDGSVEVRIAAALASIGRTGKVGPLRANLSPVDPERPYRWAGHGRQTAWLGSSLEERLGNVLARRMLDAGRLDARRNPVWSAIGLPIADVMAFLNRGTDDSLLEDILFGFTLVRWNDADRVATARRLLAERAPDGSPTVTSRAYCLLKLLFLPFGIASAEGDVAVRPESAVIPLLRAGRVGDACRIAQRRLYSAGLAPARASFGDDEDGPRLAAALLLPIGHPRELTRRVLLAEATRT